MENLLYKRLAVFFFYICFVTLPCFGATYYISTTGSDSDPGTLAEPWATFSYAMGVLSAGDSLILIDGTYTESLNITISGTSGNPIVFSAQNDGQATIDCSGSCKPLYIDPSPSRLSNITVEGIVFENSIGHVMDINYIDTLILKRLSVYNASQVNHHTISVYASTDMLIEDCAISGLGRVMINVLESSDITLRRCFTRWQSLPDPSDPNGPTNIQIYGSEDVIIENCVVTKHDTVTVDNVVGIALRGNLDLADQKVYGNIVYDLASQGHTATDYSATSDSGIIQTEEKRFLNNVAINNNYGFKWRAHDSLFVDHFTSVEHTTSNMWYAESTSGNEIGDADIRNSAMQDGTIGIDNTGWIITDGSVFGGLVHKYNNYYNITDDYDSSAANEVGPFPWTGEIDKDAEYDTATYGRGAYLFVPDSLQGLGESGEDIGAEVLYRYVDGVLTGEELWPWPMEDRIYAELGHSVTWATDNGIWKTLNGVYDSPPSEGDWLSTHMYRKKFAVDNTNVNSTLLNFPVYIPIDDDSVGAHARSDGYDIQFTKIDGTTLLNYDRERFTVVSGTAKGYNFVNIDSVHAADSTWGYIYYGDPDSGDLENESSAWNSGYELVDHFEEGYSTAASFYKDETSNNQDGTLIDANTNSTYAVSKIDSSINFNGSESDYVEITDGYSSMLSGDSTFTISFWSKVDDLTSLRIWFSRDDVGDFYGYINTDGSVRFSTSGEIASSASTVSAGTFYYIVCIKAASLSGRILVNDSEEASGAMGATPVGTTDDFKIGEYYSAEENYPFDGIIDEFRISSVARADDWLTFEYQNMNQADHELVWYSQETKPVAAPAIIRRRVF